MSVIGIIIIVVVLFFAWKYPPVALAMLLQINLIRALSVINVSNLVFNVPNEPSIVFGLLLPVTSFFLILLKLSFLKRKLVYHFDETNYLIIVLTLALIGGCIYTPNLEEALNYTAKFLLLGVSFYSITKIYLLNTSDYYKQVKRFFLATYWLGLFLATIAIILVLYSDTFVLQLTIPGVHPNPFALLIGITTVISFIIFYTQGKVFNIKRKLFLRSNTVFFVYISLVLFATNSRGVLLSTILAIISYTLLNKVKINRFKLITLSLVVLAMGSYALFLIDVDVLFSRLLNATNDQSIADRFIAYKESFNILFSTFFGTGTGGFKYYSILEYPHNLFLENMALFGVFGVFIDIYLIFLIIFLLYKSYMYRGKNPYPILLFSVFVCFLVETMFSFTLWMHKGLYLSLALISVTLYKAKSSLQK